MTNAKEKVITKFEKYVTEKVDSLNISVLAEEFSLDAVQLNGVPQSILGELAVTKSLTHLFCDPSIQERKRLDIPKGIEGFAEREGYWLEKIKPFRTKSMIFVCGDSHVESFLERLSSSGVSAQILSKGWGKELNPKSE